jgi:hypothetical protein
MRMGIDLALNAVQAYQTLAALMSGSEVVIQRQKFAGIEVSNMVGQIAILDAKINQARLKHRSTEAMIKEQVAIATALEARVAADEAKIRMIDQEAQRTSHRIMLMIGKVGPMVAAMMSTAWSAMQSIGISFGTVADVIITSAINTAYMVVATANIFISQGPESPYFYAGMAMLATSVPMAWASVTQAQVNALAIEMMRRDADAALQEVMSFARR